MKQQLPQQQNIPSVSSPVTPPETGPSFIHLFSSTRSAASVRSAIVAKRKEIAGLEEKRKGLENAIDRRKTDLERLQAELALSESPASAASELCPA